MPTRVHPGQTHRVLRGLRAAVGEEHLLEPVGGDLGDQTGGLAAIGVGVDRCDGAQATRRLLDRGDELRMLVPEVDVDEL